MFLANSSQSAFAAAVVGADEHAVKVRSCVMDYVEKGATRSKRSVEVFFKEEKKLVYITLNSCLKEQGMPEIDTTNERLTSKLTYQKNVMGSELLGFSVEDGKSRFCFPCMYTDSASDWGVQPANVASAVRKPASEMAPLKN